MSLEKYLFKNEFVILKVKMKAYNNDAKNFLIVGIGNIGEEYRGTRHNIGFQILDFWANKQGITFSSERYGSVSEFRWRGKKVYLLKPNTYVNLSGKAMRYWIDKKSIQLSQCLVVVDDLFLDFGGVRLRPHGSDGGHNGLKDIAQRLNTTKYARLRVGIGSEFSKGNQVDYVLGTFAREEEQRLPELFLYTTEMIKKFIAEGIQKASQANAKQIFL